MFEKASLRTWLFWALRIANVGVVLDRTVMDSTERDEFELDTVRKVAGSGRVESVTIEDRHVTGDVSQTCADEHRRGLDPSNAPGPVWSEFRDMLLRNRGVAPRRAGRSEMPPAAKALLDTEALDSAEVERCVEHRPSERLREQRRPRGGGLQAGAETAESARDEPSGGIQPRNGAWALRGNGGRISSDVRDCP